jgi:DNA-binding phage protein
MAGSVVIDGRLLAFTALSRAMARRGYTISRSGLSKIFKGTRDPSFRTLTGIAETLGLGLDATVDLIQRVRDGKCYRVGY